MMTAEKAADLILGNTPLPPEPVEFFRRDRDQVRTSENQARSDDLMARPTTWDYSGGN